MHFYCFQITYTRGLWVFKRVKKYNENKKSFITKQESQNLKFYKLHGMQNSNKIDDCQYQLMHNTRPEN